MRVIFKGEGSADGISREESGGIFCGESSGVIIIFGIKCLFFGLSGIGVVIKTSQAVFELVIIQAELDGTRLSQFRIGNEIVAVLIPIRPFPESVTRIQIGACIRGSILNALLVGIAENILSAMQLMHRLNIVKWSHIRFLVRKDCHKHS